MPTLFTLTRHPSAFALWAALLAAVFGAQPLVSQAPDAPSISAIPVQDNSWPLVSLNVVVRSKQGDPQTVDPQTFHLFENGDERPLRFLGPTDSPVSLALVIDSSGSIFKRKSEVLSAVTSIIKALPPDSEVMGVMFSDQAYLDLPFTPAPKVDLSFLDRLSTRGGTALYDAVVATENHFVTHAKYARRAIVIFSDGQDNTSHVSKRRAFESMERPGAPVVYPCLVAKAHILQSDTEVGAINMKFLAREGGGKLFNLDPDPASAAAQILASIRSQYVLQFTAADPSRDRKIRKLTVRLPNKDLNVHTLPGYFPPSQ